MKNSQYALTSFINSIGVLAYVSLVATFLTNAERLFGPVDNKFIIPIFMLLLLIISATITGLLVLGKPISLYLAGLKKEGITLLLSTVGWLFILLIGVGCVLLISRPEYAI